MGEYEESDHDDPLDVYSQSHAPRIPAAAAFQMQQEEPPDNARREEPPPGYPESPRQPAGGNQDPFQQGGSRFERQQQQWSGVVKSSWQQAPGQSHSQRSYYDEGLPPRQAQTSANLAPRGRRRGGKVKLRIAVGLAAASPRRPVLPADEGNRAAYSFSPRAPAQAPARRGNGLTGFKTSNKTNFPTSYTSRRTYTCPCLLF